jgi:hypothetical protein
MSISPPFGRYGQAHTANESTIKPLTIFRREALYISGATVIALGQFKCTATMAFRASLNSETRYVHEGKANARVVSNRGGGMGGGGSLDRLTLFALLPLVVIGASKLGSDRA